MGGNQISPTVQKRFHPPENPDQVGIPENSQVYGALGKEVLNIDHDRTPAPAA
jgi:hypothetical protein